MDGAVLTASRARRDFAIGILLLLLVVVLWTASNFITQILFQEGFDEPFLLTYLNTSSFAIYLIPFLYRYLRRRSKTSGHAYEPLAHEPSAEDESSTPDAIEESTHDARPGTSTNTEVAVLPPLTTRETASLAAFFCFLWFVANWTVNASLDYTSVGSTTVLASTSGIFTLIVGRLIGFEKLSLWKVSAVTTSFVGVLLVSFADSSKTHAKANVTPKPSSSTHTFDNPPNPLLGDFLALLSAAFYAFYLLLLKIRIKTESRIDMQLFFGFVGLFNIIGCWPIGLILHLTGAEKIHLPSGGALWAGIATSMATTFISDFVYVIAMLKTSPLVVTLGLTLTIPLAIVGDWFIQSRGVTLIGLCGSLMVVGAFAIIGWEDSKTSTAERALAEDVEQIDDEEENRPLVNR
ncbi:hypothetical protein CPB86DRAFT_703402 [Serendipita vermifera]|nr:hypothetical protein CPB86DRAFT_703402 [Serendipita vermifera]